MENISFYIDIFSTLLNLTILGVIIRMFSVIRIAFKEKEDSLKVQIENIEKDLQRTEKWSEREKAQLVQERDKLKDALENANIDLNSYNILGLVENVEKNLTDKIKEIVETIEGLPQQSTNTEIDFELNFLLGKGYAADKNWEQAAEHYDLASLVKPEDWELHLFRGVAHANSRIGRSTDLKSLSAYSAAIARMPHDISNDLKAKLFIYKGAMLKRLGRPEEAQIDISFGLNYALDKNIKADGLYNLASTYAMRNLDNLFYQAALDLKSFSPKYFEILINKMDYYFPHFANDSTLLDIIENRETNIFPMHEEYVISTQVVKRNLKSSVQNIKNVTDFLWQGLLENSDQEKNNLTEEIHEVNFNRIHDDMNFLKEEGHLSFEQAFKKNSEEHPNSRILELRVENISQQLKNIVKLIK